MELSSTFKIGFEILNDYMGSPIYVDRLAYNS